ncbi:ATP-grasp fold amidoligase family protein [Ornithinimicrobium sp. INDO-MA30-4]|uniref:ATP-grasp fold amidoligase family protein n=1 Tax=Ornithinimicrobium sp. INDO-MA30-4 TaxID=2908651 RepID=UPI001F412CB7|nr:ATP-grasp fold amidoligase family protein [Ornithinimicrobium sp. INDO-MA30-4]UJH70094.1 hypothetical protein L0A91_12940 [Ornithinimicrobium sp. INDO-MA30-4]
MPYNQIEYKLHNYRFGQSHGVSVPRVLEVWPTPSAIDLAEMPDLFVLKSDQGSSGRGVLPLRRIGFDSYELVDGQGSFTMASVVEHFEAREGTGKIAGPYFAEEFLDQAHSGPLPDDVKIYVCHGEVMMTLLRHVDTHGLQGEHRRRYVSAEGTDLGAVMLAMDVDDTIEMPVDYAEMVQIASHLSRALGVPFARVDLYQTTVGPVLGEITRARETHRPIGPSTTNTWVGFGTRPRPALS